MEFGDKAIAKFRSKRMPSRLMMNCDSLYSRRTSRKTKMTLGPRPKSYLTRDKEIHDYSAPSNLNIFYLLFFFLNKFDW